MLLLDYLPVAIFTIIAILFPIVTYLLSRFFRPNRPTPLRDTTYECGEVPIGEAQIQFNFQYYMFAIIFVVFDVVAVFLLLWALTFSPDSGPLALGSTILFVGILTAAVAYALKKEETIWI